MSNVVPIEIEVVGSQFKKSVGWTTAGAATGALVAGPVGAVIGLATQGNNQEFHYIIKFSDGTQKAFTVAGKSLQLDLTIWSWRINNKKTESDYVTFGMDFSTLRRDMVITASEIKKWIGTPNGPAKNLGEAWQMVKLEQKLMKFLKSEIQRYFKEQRNDVVLLEETPSGGFKIPSKSSDAVSVVLGLVVLVAMFGGCVATGTSQNQASEPEATLSTEASEPSTYSQYESESTSSTDTSEPTTHSQTQQDTYECAAETGMGEVVSREDIVNLGVCMRDKGYAIDPYR